MKRVGDRRVERTRRGCAIRTEMLSDLTGTPGTGHRIAKRKKGVRRVERERRKESKAMEGPIMGERAAAPFRRISAARGKRPQQSQTRGLKDSRNGERTGVVEDRWQEALEWKG